MIFKYSFQNCTSCSEGTVPVRITDAIVRIATRQPGIATVVQVAEAPSGAHSRRGRIAIEASSQTPYNPKNYFICQ